MITEERIKKIEDSISMNNIQNLATLGALFMLFIIIKTKK